MSESSFRGIKGIQDIKKRMLVLVDFYEQFRRPEVRELTVSRADYDLIARWPRAAHIEGYAVTDNGIFFRSLRLTFDTGQGRYQKPQLPKQEIIT